MSLVALGERQNQNLVKRLAEIFEEQGPRLFGEIRRAWTDKDHGRLRESAHALKGSARALGMPALTKVCFELESLASGASILDTDEVLTTLELELEHALAALRQFLLRETALRQV